MCRPPAIAIALVVAAGSAGCSPVNLPPAPSAATTLETGTVAVVPPAGAPIETATTAPGTPTEVYALVAGGALRCWFGADGPLKATHVFHAEAAPPSEGGVAEIVLHERDATMRDQRGARAFRVSFTASAGGVHVGITTIKVAAPLSELMTRDVAVWASGGSGCHAGALSPPPQAAVAPTPKLAKTKASRSSGQ
jgi:hypothetical protein